MRRVASTTPIFLVGAPCAGTSPVFELLARAEQVGALDAERRQSVRELLAGRSGPDSDRLIARDATPELGALLRQTLSDGLRDRHGDASPEARWLSGSLANAWRIPLLAELFPEAQFIYVHRDPREQLIRMLSAWASGQWVTRPELAGWTGPAWSFPLIPQWSRLAGLSLEEIVAAQWAATTEQILTDFAALPAQRWCAIGIDRFLADRPGEAASLGRFAGLAWRVAPKAVARMAMPPLYRAERYARSVGAMYAPMEQLAARADAFVREHHPDHREPPRSELWHTLQALPGRVREEAARRLATSGLAVGLFSGAAAAPLVASAANPPITVTNTDDSGAGSLRAALVAANAAPGADVINFAAGVTGTIDVASQLPVTDSVTINGPGAMVLAVDGQAMSRVFYLYSKGAPTIDVTIAGLTIQNGSAAKGAGLLQNNVNLTLQSSVISGNAASGKGGGLYFNAKNGGTLIVQGSTISGNTAKYGGGAYLVNGGGSSAATLTNVSVTNNTVTGYGAGIFASSFPALDLESCVISGNVATGGSGGIEASDVPLVTVNQSSVTENQATQNNWGGLVAFYGTSVNVTNSTISWNYAGGSAGGMAFYNSSALVQNCTITGNTSIEGAAGILNEQSTLTLANSTVVGNMGGGGPGLTTQSFRSSTPATSTVINSIVSGNTGNGPADVINYGTVAYDVLNISFSLIGNVGTTTYTPGSGNLVGTPAQLGTLQNNGGPTQTMLPACGSPTVNAGDPSFAAPPALDQRGLTRVVDAVVDMGAVELQTSELAACVDAGMADAGASLDAGAPDAGPGPDAGVVDAGPAADAGTIMDAGFIDAGTPTDGGIVVVADAGSPEDAGLPVVDAGQIPDAGETADAGEPLDAGPMMEDAGPGIDAGPAMNDAGPMEEDAGPPVDAGVRTSSTDGGPVPVRAKSGGCGCDPAGSDAALGLVMPLGLILRRRRPARTAR